MANFTLPDLLTSFGINAVRVKAFDPVEFETDDPIATSQLGTPIFTNLVFSGGTYEDLDGNVIDYDGLRIDTAVITINQEKNIVRTAVQGRNGTVKQYASDGDFVINVRGALVSEAANVYPRDEAVALRELMKVPETLRVTSEFLQLFDIDDIVIKSHNFPQSEGFRNVQLFTFQAWSDKPLELQTLQATQV